MAASRCTCCRCARSWACALRLLGLLRHQGRADEKRWQALLARIPLGRVAAARDVAGATFFFCSSASDFVTGQVLYVDGGITASK